MSEQVIEVEGESIEEAIDKGLKRLRQNQSDTEIEILQEPDTELFDAGNDPARVRMRAQGIDLLDSLKQIVEKILMNMGLTNFTVNVSIEGNFYMTDIESEEELRFIIGRYGETLNALQHIAEQMLNKIANQPVDVIVDADNYRERRRHELQKLAHNVSSRVKEKQEEVELEPMIAVERKAVHEKVKQIDGVKTYSIGEDTNRRVVIQPMGQS